MRAASPAPGGGTSVYPSATAAAAPPGDYTEIASCRVNACDRAEKYEALKEEFAGISLFSLSLISFTLSLGL